MAGDGAGHGAFLAQPYAVAETLPDEARAISFVDGNEEGILETQASLLKDFDWKLSNQSKFEVGLDLYNHF